MGKHLRAQAQEMQRGLLEQYDTKLWLPSDAETARAYPRFRSGEVPTYPPAALNSGISGAVRLQVTVAGGAPQTVNAVRSEHSILSDAATANIRTWRFEPADAGTFIVSFAYRIATRAHHAPPPLRVEMEFPIYVAVTAPAPKPTAAGLESYPMG